MLFLGCLFDRESEAEYLSKSKCGLSNAANTFQWNLIEGIKENKEPVTIVNALPVGVYPKQYRDLILPNRTWEHKKETNYEIGSINFPFVKQYQRYRAVKKKILELQDKEIIIYSAYEPFLRAVYCLDPSYKVTAIITDLPEFYDLGKSSFLHQFMRKQNNKKIARYMKRVDSFVLLTEAMKGPLQVEKRPYTVIEGICNAKPCEVTETTEEKTILYTGTLHRKFGICTLLEAFSMIDDPDCKLWICGGGDSRQAVAEAAEKDKRITFFGYVTKAEVEKLQQRAALLINPRNNDGEYTKYSFPSKTMEYMLSGKPVVMYKLDGIPDEYDPYLFYVDGTGPEAMRNAIVSFFDLPEKTREEFGRAAADFVLREKNKVVQAEKVLNLMEER